MRQPEYEAISPEELELLQLERLQSVSNNVVSMSNNLGLSPPSVSVNVVSKILRLRVEAISIAGRYS